MVKIFLFGFIMYKEQISVPYTITPQRQARQSRPSVEARDGSGYGELNQSRERGTITISSQEYGNSHGKGLLIIPGWLGSSVQGVIRPALALAGEPQPQLSSLLKKDHQVVRINSESKF